MKTLTLPGFEALQEPSTIYGDPRLVYVDSLPRFPKPVILGLRHELLRLETAGVPAYALQRNLYTPHGQYLVTFSGKLLLVAPLSDFGARAGVAAKRMETQSGYSFNKTFARTYIYIKEDSHA